MKFFSDQNLSYADILLPHESQCGWLELWVQKQCGLSSELLKILEGNEPCFFTTYFCWDPTKAIAQGNSFQKKAALLFGTHHVVEDKSNGGNQGPRQRAEALASLNSASTTYHVQKSGNQVQKFRPLMMH
ncbi:hypothetical protein ISN45_Aa08g009680 [Arabidopsis thaliana x Arabidopsis arenosa]|uniref:Uncharacterized protein n=1 Tax=Arabidopsis thaliana x Arabidopsis arenosa TaxID=1240361 RepID=A0A8T1XL81_9BRAS|nr:hypothetical protein ISN45_Aa08g009680 [Arabidopsis thaliana x Arabidopsis arenosa]